MTDGLYRNVDIVAARRAALLCRAMWTLVSDLDAFLQEHRRCGKMGGGVDGQCVWMTCDGCGASLSRSLVCADKLPANRVNEM